MCAMGPANPPLPPELLHAVAEQAGRIALVLGAGCSLEQPTGLQLATEYSLDVHRQLIQDGLLVEGECEHPEDLSSLASTVWEQHGSQSLVVERLPRNEFRQAQPNEGYLIAAALLREGVVTAVLSLNFDLAMTAGLGRVGAKEVNVVPGPAAIDQLGAATVIYLHRNVDEPNADRWILRLEALQAEWQGGWEEIVAQRVMSCPIVVFAGLGSPAAVLTQTLAHVRGAVGAGHQAYVVDPAAQTEFQEALDLPAAAHIRLGWCAFMERLADRLVEEFSHSLAVVCGELCQQHGWVDEEGFVAELCERLHAIGLIRLGALRASWLLDSVSYSPDDARRGLLADLLLGVGLVERHHGGEAHFRENGTVQLSRDGQMSAPFLAISGSGTLRWNALEAKVRESVNRIRDIDRPGAALLSGVQGGRPDTIAAPEDVVGDWIDDIAQGEIRTDLLTVDEIRDDPLQSRRLVA
jgi:hypothetical protein